MTAPVTFVPHPRLDYTEKYNHQQDTLRLRRLQDKRAELEREARKLADYKEEQRVNEKREMQQLLEDLHKYNSLSRAKMYNDYKYAYWVGTLVDEYI